MVPSAAAKALPIDWPLPQQAPRDIRILVVDDQELVRLPLLRMLRQHGFHCQEAADGAATLELCRHQHFDLVLCDIQMPGLSGLDLVRALAGRIPDTAFVMVSSMDDAGTAMECLRQGAYGYVLKPFKTNDILIAVANGLRRRMLELEYRDREKLLAARVAEQTVLIRNSREEVALRLISASEHRDNETGAHVRRIGLYAAEMARLLGWDAEAREAIQAAAPMHDIGKIGVPDRILQKQGPLTEEEWILMRDHTTIGAAILKDSTVPFIRMGARIARHHHEKWDGSGYPNSLRGEEIPQEARITCLVDVFDALSSRRSYKQAWREEEVLDHLRAQRGRMFDPHLVDLFLQHFPVFQAIRNGNPDVFPEPELPESPGSRG
jgi:putative two-component system response regulator